MFDRKRVAAGRGGVFSALVRLAPIPRRALRPTLEGLESRQLLAATIAPISTILSPTTVGEQLPVFGGTTDQTFTVSSDNALVPVTVTQGKFMTINVTHVSSGANDPAFSGSMTFQLFDDLTPLTTSRIEQLVNQGFYTNKTFHRILPGFPGPNDFIVQGGSVDGSGGGSVNQPGFPYADEYVQQLVYSGQGQLAIANAGPGTNDSQFFATTGSPRFLDFTKTIFGQIVSGQSTLAALTKVAADTAGKPLGATTITSATLANTNPNGVLHIDSTQAPAGTVANVTVTATETATGQQTSRTFQVDVTANVDATGKPITETPALGLVSNVVVGQNQTAVFLLPTINASNVPVQYTVQGGVTTSSTGTKTFTPVPSNVTATVSSTGVVTVVPKANLPANTVVTLLVGIAPASASATDPTKFLFQTMTVTFNGGPPVAQQPIAVSSTASVVTNTATPIQLKGNSTISTQTLTFKLLSQPSHGAITNFNPSTGAFIYTPNKNFQGSDSLTFNVTTVGPPTPNLTSNPGTLTINVVGGDTASVRVIGRVLVVTPPPRTDKGTNTITLTQSATSTIVTEVNGVIDATQPNVSTLDSIVVYGSKASDNISVDPAITLPTTLNGGQGGQNTILGGGGANTLQGWFGQNTLTGGVGTNSLLGQQGHVRFKSKGANQIIYAGQIVKRTNLHGIKFPGIPHKNSTREHEGTPPVGTNFKLVNSHLVALPKRNAKIQVVNNAPATTGAAQPGA
jgi:cyclophilin family peptidyl-prolyl cis-trans isomerase